jgi:ribosomal protein S6--L-glutamate ligase
MKIGVVSKNESFWATSEIIRSLKRKHVRPVYLHTPRIHLALEAQRADAIYENRSLRKLDVVIPRIGRSLTQLGLMLLKHLELMEIPSTLSAYALLTARNKYFTLQALHAAGVRFPESVLIALRDRNDLLGYLSPPLVLKLLTGTQGIGVMRVRDVKEAGPIIDTLSELDQMICLQKYVPNPGEDLRVFVIDGEIVAAMKRKAAPQEWRSNIHIGGHGVAHKLTETESETALKAADAVGVEIAGVDLISAKGNPFVIEVNASPGFRGLLAATGINAADKIASYAIQKTKR